MTDGTFGLAAHPYEAGLIHQKSVVYLHSKYWGTTPQSLNTLKLILPTVILPK